jgi:hypothetical protein
MFDPINSDHAIQTIGFAMVFDGPVGDSAARSLRSNREILADLPAVQEPQAVQFAVQGGPSPSVSQAHRLSGVQLAHLRPDGTPAWALRLMGNELAVECSRYTRWERVWSSSEKYLATALQAVRGANSDRKVTAIAMDVVDVFLPEREDYDLSRLLREGPLVAGKAFSAGPTWHSHVGWFDRIAALGQDSELCLNHLNIDAVRLTDGEKPLRIMITHHQELRPSASLPLPAKSDLARFMGDLHLRNKSTLNDLLISSMSSRIGLENNNASA